jgi:hypothetical protein
MAQKRMVCVTSSARIRNIYVFALIKSFTGMSFRWRLDLGQSAYSGPCGISAVFAHELDASSPPR